MTIALNIIALAKARQRKEQADHVVKALRSAWEEENAFHLSEQADAATNLADAEAIVKQDLLADFADTGARGGLKSIGAEVKLYETLDYPESDALAWAKESGLCLVLDKKGFEKVAKATDLPFVTKREDPRVSIASDLTPFAPITPEA